MLDASNEGTLVQFWKLEKIENVFLNLDTKHFAQHEWYSGNLDYLYTVFGAKCDQISRVFEWSQY
jgi:hypothetical protein